MTGSIRLFVNDTLAAGAEIGASPEQAHYLGSVMRRGPGDPLLLFNGVDGEYRAEIRSIRRDKAVYAVLTRSRVQLPEPQLTLLFAVLKRDTTDLLVAKATELGVTRLQPVFSARTNAGRLNLDRCGAIAREAAEQCERLSVPQIGEPARLLDLLGTWPGDRVLHVAIERGSASPPGVVAFPAALLVGPEGGFTPAELDALRRLPFVEPIGLGPLILRAETAALVGLALLQAASWR